ncbi:MAG: putative manganese-dependent inorganic diphosphatase [Treponema sp.]|jgi:manganese-dependent inorganic pyrophosphatase|nr:putative manganese-dependent inorganic diphosphatase [Treponema sp.]
MKPQQKRVYVIGHRNPDTDSVVSAVAFADLRKNMGHPEYVAARAGKINPQTEYIFNRFKVPVPEYVPDLVPKVSYYMPPINETVNCKTSLWNAIAKMESCSTKVLPVVDDEGHYHSLLHYNAFSKNILATLDPEKSSAFITSISLMQETLNAQPLITFNEHEVFKCSLLVAASQFESFKQMLNMQSSENSVVITGDRADIQEYCIEKGIRALIISTGYIMSKALREKAEKHNVSVLISPYDTASTAMLSVYATPVSTMADKAIQPVKATDFVRRIRTNLLKSPSRTLPVIADDSKVIGTISESDLLQEANIEISLVDHNEQTQAVEGIENYTILEIIDHHRLGNISTRNPITFINKPVGATSTIITNLYRENRIPISKEIASLLLSGILADTLSLHSATTTETDIEAAEFLSNVTNLDIEKLGMDIAQAAGQIYGRSAAEVIHQDMKEYQENGFTFTVSQIEIDNPDEIIARKAEFIKELDIERRATKSLFCSLMVTDITRLTSVMLISGDSAFLQVIGFPKREESVYMLKDIVSRKKQLIPLLGEQIDKFSDGR